ncbi:DNA topoisomerase (ATP-hydrolyzing) subunit B [Candidatus Pacearchaeota archaeon]|nr:DNA topoisomerase (ATP-hydrolyzing) subunit B [Candidatus Pacearchaeota archaeon]
MAEEYNAKSIKVLEGLEAVRLRPAMYIGSTSKDGLHHCVYEVIDNSIDEVQAGFATLIEIIINKDGSITIIDNGRGIPVDKHESGKSALEVALTKLHAGGKFENKVYEISGGLHGVGLSCVNALSIKLTAQIKRDGKVYEQSYKRGVPEANVKVVDKIKEGETGTSITFWPDSEIFSTLEFDFGTIATRIRELAFLNPSVKLILEDKRKESVKKEEFHYEGGLVEFVSWINRSKSSLHKPVYFNKKSDSTIVEVAVQYVDGYQENIFSFVNTINTIEGGTHVSGFKTALTRAINDYATKKGLLKNEKLSGDDTREGLTTVISIKMKQPQFEGQTKTKLGNSEIKGLVDSMVSVALGEYFEEHPDIASKISNKCISAAKAREAAKKARDLVRRKSIVGFSGLPGKLADCSSKKFEQTEMYIVEGNSAGGCFSGDTKVALADGRNISFKQLLEEHKQGKKNFCYTINNDGSIGIEKIENPRITKRNAEVMKIILDNNQEIICTLDHKFMLRGGGYKEADELTKDDSLMPLYEREINIIPRNNHKIIKIEKLTEKIDVYDIEVPDTHNFALASGVFVHNSAKMARDKEFQAILPLKGKPLNVEKANPVKVLSSDEIINLITAIGTGIKESFDIKKLRYNKIIIMTDADVDGQHIRTLLLTFFFRYMPELIENGNIFVAISPLYRIRHKGKDSYVYSDEELEKEIKKIEGNPDVQRFKGLGEMNPPQLWDTTMDPKKRIFKKIAIEDAIRADEVFTMLMGDAVGPRRKFIELNANIAELDI